MQKFTIELSLEEREALKHVLTYTVLMQGDGMLPDDIDDALVTLNEKLAAITSQIMDTSQIRECKEYVEDMLLRHPDMDWSTATQSAATNKGYYEPEALRQMYHIFALEDPSTS